MTSRNIPVADRNIAEDTWKEPKVYYNNHFTFTDFEFPVSVIHELAVNKVGMSHDI